MPSHSTHINYYTRPACMGLGTLKITNFPIINRTAGLNTYLNISDHDALLFSNGHSVIFHKPGNGIRNASTTFS